MNIEYYYDIVCPYSYLATSRIEVIAARANANIIWKPCLLGGIYKLTQAPQGKDGSATDVMPQSKQILFAKDLRRQFIRYGIPFNMNGNSKHPIKTLYAQRVLTYLPPHQRITATKALYKAYWVENQDLSDLNVISHILSTIGIKISNIQTIVEDEQVKKKLQETTEELVQRGGFGVPSYYIPSVKRLYFGSDRLHFVEKSLGNVIAHLPRFYTETPSSKRSLRFYFDFSSPWAYIGFTQLQRIQKETNCQIEFVPILLGALFRDIGTPNVPLLKLIEPKRNYQSLDLKDWCEWWNVKLNWPSTFPIRSVLPLRIALVEPKTIPLFFKAAWVDNKDISDVNVVKTLLFENSFSESLLKDAETQKEKLKENTEKAKTRGVCGVPTYQVDNGDLIWGQDRSDIVMDILCGWKVPAIQLPWEVPPKSAL